ncbi:MAG: GNAT family N-acetyltransferase [Rickettsiales bacterium]|nr:GNAT family N-acetyltransferase [Rickettsiales bacterium]
MSSEIARMIGTNECGGAFKVAERIEVRRLGVGDAIDFVEFMEKMVSETNFLLPTLDEVNRDIEKQKKMIENFGSQKNVFVAWESNSVVGFLGLTRLGMNKVKHIANFAIGVLKSCRRRGIATGLMLEGERWLRSEGVRRVEMTVAVSNVEAISLYKKLGFREEGLRAKSLNIDGELQDELYMGKILE